MPARAKINWPVSFAVWTGIGLVLTVQTFATVDMPAANESQERMNFWMTIYFQIARAWLWCLLMPAVFELRRRIPMRGFWMPFGLLLHVAFASAFIVWIFGVRSWVMQPFMAQVWMPIFTIDGIISGISARQLIDVTLYLGLIGAGYSLDLGAEKKESERRENELRVQLTQQQLREEQLRSELVQAEMKALKQQLHPHFLFNALNAVSGLVRQQENSRAVEALSQVSSLLRALIGSTGRPEVSLEEEIRYCETYLSIEKMRFDQRLNYSFEVSAEAAVAEVPTLLLQPMVENAIKHGIACRRNPGWVRVRAWVVDQTLHLEVQNDPAEMPRGQSAPESHGVGLDTTRKRLERAFGAAFHLSCNVNTPAGTIASIELPFRPVESAVPLRV